ncbi:CPBP family intramembrane metalloprotease [Algoriphagus lacus]|uniref:CPBP family intramembrane metalloprotease n=1 Tax=Algoriphagus lacus TaxID=2056311 RepID=A0A418PN69_9BACT|nr:CPBP family intramembrane glutamic endopeptidase [Algoriphagus lacus]RIW13335.1 CPBP family intramembrane metalloprotease [Algoriphagus lacus]
MKNYDYSFVERLKIASMILGIFFLLDQFSNDFVSFLFPATEGYFKWGIRMLLEVSVVLLSVCLIFRENFKGGLERLTLNKSLVKAFLFGMIVTLPTAITYAFGSGFQFSWKPEVILFYTVLSPFAEEVLYRGLAFWLIYRYLNVGFWWAAILPSLVFGIGHFYQASDFSEQIGVVALTAFGGLWFSWIFSKWKNIWFPIFLHILLNFWFELFEVGVTALGDTTSIIARLFTLGFSIWLTLKKDKFEFLRFLNNQQ